MNNMNNNAHNSKRIAKNTMMLYVRTMILILVALYTSRVVLNTLGETDFGIYSIVGGVVVLFSFIQGAMTSATQRFLNFEMGKGDESSVNRVFSMSMTAHISIALFLLLLAETVGLWFVNTQLNIPTDRVYAVQWVYQFSVLTTIISIIRTPYNALIIANEKMSYYAYISIVESALKLIIVYLLLVISEDKLIMYSILIFCVSLIIMFCYKVYCNYNFATSRYRLFWDFTLYRELFNFSAWSLFGSVANVAVSQGINILLNVFYGVTVNAAMAITNQVQSAVSSFTGNFQTAFNPQLVKSYAEGDNDYFIKLICQTSKFSFFLIYPIVFPIILFAGVFFEFWLNDVPEYTVQFSQLILVFILIESVSSPLWTSVQATGKIRNYQIMVSFIMLANLPIIYMLFKFDLSPVWAIFVRTLIGGVTYIARVIYLKHTMQFPIKYYLKKVILPYVKVMTVSLPIPLIINNYSDSFESKIIVFIVSVIICGVSILYVGLNNNERQIIKNNFLKRNR